MLANDEFIYQPNLFINGSKILGSKILEIYLTVYWKCWEGLARFIFSDEIAPPAIIRLYITSKMPNISSRKWTWNRHHSPKTEPYTANFRNKQCNAETSRKLLEEVNNH